MDRYSARINLRGETQRNRFVSRLRDDIANKAPYNPSYKEVLLNGEPTHLVIHSGTQPYYKVYTSLPDQEILLGDYVEFANETWLVYSCDSDDEVYIDGDLRQCNYTMYWQKSDGSIVSRKVWVQNASAYNNGVQGNQTIELQSNQFMIFMPYDSETIRFGENVGMRFNMTRDKSICSAYELTRFDEITYAYGKRGMLNLILTQSQFNDKTDKLVTLDDGTQVWICDYAEDTTTPSQPIPTPDESNFLLATISGGDTLKCGRNKSWTVAFTDKDGNEVTDCTFQWNVVGEYQDDITQTVTGNKIQLRTDNEDCIGSSILLQIVVDDSVVAEIEIAIMEGF